METGSNIAMIKESYGNPKNLISKYGKRTIDDIKTHAQTHIGNQTRQA